jgi:serine/threonine protein kinase
MVYLLKLQVLFEKVQGKTMRDHFGVDPNKKIEHSPFRDRIPPYRTMYDELKPVERRDKAKKAVRDLQRSLLYLIKSLRVLHDRNLVHGDLTPANIMLRFRDNDPIEGDVVGVTLIDLGMVGHMGKKQKERGAIEFRASESATSHTKNSLSARNDIPEILFPEREKHYYDSRKKWGKAGLSRNSDFFSVGYLIQDLINNIKKEFVGQCAKKVGISMKEVEYIQEGSSQEDSLKNFLAGISEETEGLNYLDTVVGVKFGEELLPDTNLDPVLKEIEAELEKRISSFPLESPETQ